MESILYILVVGSSAGEGRRLKSVAENMDRIKTVHRKIKGNRQLQKMKGIQKKAGASG